jgi:hypothetical protein
MQVVNLVEEEIFEDKKIFSELDWFNHINLAKVEHTNWQSRCSIVR